MTRYPPMVSRVRAPAADADEFRSAPTEPPKTSTTGSIWSRGPRADRSRHERWLREGDMSVGRRLAQIGVLGWIFVVPTLRGVFFGRWLDGTLRPASSGAPR